MEDEDAKLKPEKQLGILDLRQLDLRVGLVTNVESLTLSDGLYFLSIDIGKEEDKFAPTTGLVSYYKLGSLIDRKVLVACNLPPLFQDGEEATVKVMCAMTEDRTEVLEAPKVALPGERVFAPGFTQDKYWIIKQRNYNKVVVDLRVNSQRQAEYRGVPLQVDGRSGFITCKTLTDTEINHA